MSTSPFRVRLALIRVLATVIVTSWLVGLALFQRDIARPPAPPKRKPSEPSDLDDFIERHGAPVNVSKRAVHFGEGRPS